MDGFPEGLEHLVSSFVSNSLLRGFGCRSRGHMELRPSVPKADHVPIEFPGEGIGMSEEKLNRVFEPLITEAFGQGESDLEMNIAYNIVKNVLDGNIVVTPAPGHWMLFIVDIPGVARIGHPHTPIRQIV